MISDDGQPFSETVWLTSSYTCMTSCVFKVRTCTLSLQKSGRAKTRLARPLATAMMYPVQILITQCTHVLIYCDNTDH